MWSGPRNISTALMRSWGNRPDTCVCDEPFYACYLKETGLAHPMAEDVIRHHECDSQAVIRFLTGPLPDGKTVFYQKQMAHHMLPSIDRGWFGQCVHAFLIRDPREMLLSLAKHLEAPTVVDTGLPQQAELFRQVTEVTGEAPAVIDSKDVLENPGRLLRGLCDRFGVPFDGEAMLRWPAGARETDGIWASEWYSEVLKTTGFAQYRPREGALPDSLKRVLEECRPLYEALYEQRLR
ncbi:MAG: HAD family hydrolase [Planctomycetes bacterium]|nr:HAD family hydrolase [Planctomycetota bacterium]NOG53421.1 HAD family hydrolase [Planctomycetota bacterium]